MKVRVCVKVIVQEDLPGLGATESAAKEAAGEAVDVNGILIL